jgi:hypothetical protein
MLRIWEFAPWLPYEIGLEKLVPNCQFLNSEEVHLAGMSSGHKRNTPFPVPRLELTLSNFSVDCFIWEGYTLVSERMRSVMALPQDEVEYFSVDASSSCEIPRAMNYMVMSVAVTDRVSYPQETKEFFSEQDFLASMMPDAKSINVDGTPRHRLFHDEHFIGSIYCTDELAMSVLRAGCTGVRFLDPRYSPLVGPMRFRTLRGVEQEGAWDPVRKVEHTTLIEEVTEPQFGGHNWSAALP